MSHSYHNGFYHFVWATWNRMPLLTSNKEQHAYALIHQQCKRMNAEIIALGGIADHVHLLVTVPTTLCLADFMEAVKGVSSNVLNKTYGSPTFAFKWQGGYSYHTVSVSHVRVLRRYVENQKKHHADASLWPSCELPEPAGAPAEAGRKNFDSPAVQGGD